jgi:pyridinium-3,5-biscarboxylic acid mononucleotide synthase
MNEEPLSPFVDLRHALRDEQHEFPTFSPNETDTVRIDTLRWRRTGIPEIVHAGTKSTADIAEGLRQLAQAQGRALASRVRPEHLSAISELLEPELLVEVFERPGCVVAAQPGAVRPVGGGVVGILSAGSSDVPIAAEASLIAAEMGASVLEAWDVGVAGLHRLVEPLEQFADHQVDVIVVAAGMDGALPSVVAGLVDVPVIGLPTSVGYGFGGGGIGALTSMLQSCAPGLVVVNIDNGIGAGATAALIANRAARSRSR